jgi:iron complex outermembrane receptor protein
MKKSSSIFKLSILSLSLLSAGLNISVLAQSLPTQVGTVKITGAGDSVGNGLIIDEDGVKQKSTVTKAAIDKSTPSSNPFQLLNLEPGVNAYSYDATGLFGGNMRVRGFNSDEMGFTINGAPVNDSGNFAVYPQEYADVENLCEISITQGSVDTEAPHIGASGGNVGMVSCSPKDQFGGKFSLSLGDLSFKRSFLRLDTGLIGKEHPIKAYVSYSESSVNKFKGPGQANKNHVDTGFEWKLTDDTLWVNNLLYNYQLNNNFLTLTKAEFAQNPNLDYSSNIPQHLASGSESGINAFGVSSATASGVRAQTAYYGYSLNPFINYLYTSRLQTRIDDQLTLSAEPYYWYGYGTGGQEQNTLTESTAGINGGISNFTSNGNNGTAVGVYRGSVTETKRPGVTFKANYSLENQKVMLGLWLEQANHRQTQPATTLTNSGGIGDIWLANNLITYNNGSLYEGRNYLTQNTAYSAFVQDTITMGRLDLNAGLRVTSLKRDFTNYASSGTGMGANYATSVTYSKPLLSLGARYKFDEQLQAYGNVSQNQRAPSNFVLSGWVTGGTFVNGVLTGYSLNPNTAIQAETSTTYESGLRWNTDSVLGSVALFDVEFKNRIASGYNPTTATTTDYNVGDSRVKGLEMQLGSKPVNGWSIFGSATYTQSLILNNYPATATSTLPTAGATFPDTPLWMYSASMQYSSGPYMAALSGKYTGKRYTTLVNDEYLDAYTVFDFNAGYRFPSGVFFKQPTVRLNMSNIFNTKYLLANSGSGSNITTTVNTSATGGGIPTYYVGAPRFASVTFSSDF